MSSKVNEINEIRNRYFLILKTEFVKNNWTHTDFQLKELIDSELNEKLKDLELNEKYEYCKDIADSLKTEYENL